MILNIDTRGAEKIDVEIALLTITSRLATTYML